MNASTACFNRPAAIRATPRSYWDMAASGLSSIDRRSSGIARAGRPSLIRRAPSRAQRSALRAWADDLSGDFAAPAEIPGTAGFRNFELALEAFARKDSRSMAGLARGMRSARPAVRPGTPRRGDTEANGTRPPCPFRDFAIDLLFGPGRPDAPTSRRFFYHPDALSPNRTALRKAADLGACAGDPAR